ncbi:TPA: hypothetical protein HA351_04380 [Methanosarcinaceae archaeon]|nr:hypothetical protein [Methanosarcinaceae archaeon]
MQEKNKALAPGLGTFLKLVRFENSLFAGFSVLLSDAEIEPIILFFAAITFIVGLAFEIMIDIADVPGDRRFRVRTVAVCRSGSSAAKLSTALYAGIMLLDPLPFFVNMNPRLYRDWIFLALALVPVLSYLFLCRVLLRTSPQKKSFTLEERPLRSCS